MNESGVEVGREDNWTGLTKQRRGAASCNVADGLGNEVAGAKEIATFFVSVIYTARAIRLEDS